MKKIFFETLKHKLGHYLLVIFCGILMVSTIYVSYAFSDSIEGIINGQNSGIVEEMYTFINFQETYILLFILMVLVIISYIRKKSYDYVLLDTMGLKKKHRYMFIGFEYAGIIFSSVTGGLILGKILAECAKTVLQNIFYNTITTEVNYGFVALRNTLVISCEVFGILFIVFDELIACLGMDALLTVGKKNGKAFSGYRSGVQRCVQYQAFGRSGKNDRREIICDRQYRCNDHCAAAEDGAAH